MNSEPKLDLALVWDPAGHLSDAALTALVDGELGLLPSDAVGHAEGCVFCADRLGRAALFSVELSGALDQRLAQSRSISERAVRRYPLPVGAVAAALAVAVIGLLPTLRGLPALLGQVWNVWQHAVPVYAHGTLLALTHARQSGVFALSWLLTAVFLVMAGVWIARRTPVPMGWKGAS